VSSISNATGKTCPVLVAKPKTGWVRHEKKQVNLSLIQKQSIFKQMKSNMKNKTIKSVFIMAALTIGLGLSSCKKECLSKFKEEASKNCDSGSSDTLRHLSREQLK
jgi:hypothetical protein